MPGIARKVVWIDVVGLTPRLLAHAPTLAALGARGSTGPLTGVVPAVTLTAQATALTGLPPSGHGVVGNGWFHRDTSEVRFWLQSSALISGEPVYAAARRLASARGLPFTACPNVAEYSNENPFSQSALRKRIQAPSSPPDAPR